MFQVLRSFNAAVDFSRAVKGALVATALCGAMALLLHWSGGDVVAALRDGSLSATPEAGLFSDLGIALMAIAGCIAACGGLVGRSGACKSLAVFCLVFAADDALMLHERLNRFEFVAYAGYGLGFSYVWYRFALVHRMSVLWPFVFVLVAFVASATVDQLSGLLALVLPEGFGGPPTRMLYVMEDVPKLVAILCLSLVAANEGIDALQRRRSEGRTPDPA